MKRLPNPYYDPWEDITCDLPELITSEKLKDKLESLPLLSTALLDTEEEWRRAYVVLSFLSQGYIWSGNPPRRVSLLNFVVFLISHELLQDTNPVAIESSDSNCRPAQKSVRVSHHPAMWDICRILSLEHRLQPNDWKSTNEPTGFRLTLQVHRLQGGGMVLRRFCCYRSTRRKAYSPDARRH